MQVGELWVKIGGRDETLNATLSTVEKKLQGVGKNLSSLGGDLTKKITLPVVAATTAVGGLVASFGWGRLKGMDAAESQLKGLGYTVADVERISGQVLKAVQGTTMTMAEGTSVAAGALAAGVDEGAELENYIRQVGNAAVGANRPIADMASIFNRVQGSGKLMTQELNMIEDGMPGFAATMSKSLGVSQAEFRKMVTDGEVSSKQFLAVMDDFAGGMSEAYSNSWQGMVSNTKAWIGIIGENLLSGVFEQSKESVGEFMELLKSEEVQAWAQQTGVAVGEAFTTIIAKVKEAIEWWTGLDDSTKKVILTMAGIAIAIGPVLTIIGKLIAAVTAITKGFALLKTGAIIVGGAIGAITAPVAIAIAAIAAIIAIGVLLYQNWDTIKEKAAELSRRIAETWAAIKADTIEVWTSVKDWLYSLWEGIKNQVARAWDSIYKTLANVWDMIKTGFAGLVDSAKSWGSNLIQNFISGIEAKWDDLKTKISDAAGMVSDFLGFSSPTKEGPGKYADRWAPNLINMFAEGITASLPRLQVSVADMAAMLTPAVVVGHTGNSVSNNYGGNTFQIYIQGGSTREQADSLMRELAKRGVRF